MKTTLYKLLILAIIAPGLAFCHNDFTGKHTEKKKISKEFKVSATSNLMIDNSYGNIDISTWDENRVVIEVFIETNGNDAEAVRKKLEEINVEFNQSSSGVSAKTHFSKENQSWWNQLFGGSNNVNMQVNYVVKAPARNNVNISNDYGGIYLDRLLGNSRISCDYGKIDIGELRGNSNDISFDYTRNSHIGYVKNAEINADYSDYVIEEAGKLNINADYTSSKILKVEDATFNCDYGSISVEKVKKLYGNGDYLTTKIGRVFTSVILDLDYGSASVEKLVKGTREVKIESDYTGIKIGYDEAQPFSFDITTSYGDVNGVDSFEVNKRHDSGTKKTYQGYHLSEGSGNQVSISTSYGSVSFRKQ
ncbi:hypothetical protein RM553_16280 [Zunongwangia sp. F363]|uniref:Adhesin domain-containing protein n=1 Tax=Autumnicola tepida TaxID=3075595 RepID=A0ABU3CDV6_9FLAO|nr:hypothetical protein [Zunongwangia sp. F363]MDT0644397.1 hypothetical protein [Zunongwangia sp. F363]